MTIRTSTGFVSRILGPASFDEIFLNGCIEVYSGPQPESADHPATGALLGRVTRDGLTWTPGNVPGGLRFTRNGRYALKDPTDSWLLKGLANGVAGWWRLRGNAYDPGGPSLLLPRIDGSIRADGSVDAGDMTLASTSITTDTSSAFNHFWYAIPPLGD